ncbi:DUF4148 domain-containing protein [Ramlibacter sp. AN1133]|uniref:DUF4148 domain-containing protein n=1 Tax=Ramlibacter sp. AN1133 TaxID=3133429 RepID=UPI0030BA5E70
MKDIIRQAAFLVALAALGATASAQTAKTREQVRSELAEAIRSGDIISGESGLTLREQFPGRYPAVPKAPGLSRAQVQAELAQAIRDGELVSGGEIAQRAADGLPGAFPRELQVGQRTRAEVKAELAEAIRTGNILAAGESGQLRNQLNPSQYGAPLPKHMMAGTEMPDATVR